MLSRMNRKKSGVTLSVMIFLIGLALFQGDNGLYSDQDDSSVSGQESRQPSGSAETRAADEKRGQSDSFEHLEVIADQYLSESTDDVVSVDRDKYLFDHFQTVGDVRPGAESRYQASLKTLRNNPETVGDLVNLFNDTDKMQWNRQWLIVETLGELDPMNGMEVFVAVLKRPSVVTAVPHGIPNLERMIQFSAVDQVLRASKQGSAYAKKILAELQYHPEIEVIEYLMRHTQG